MRWNRLFSALNGIVSHHQNNAILYISVLLASCLTVITCTPDFACAEEWYVQLIVSAPDDTPPIRVDDRNVLGRLNDAFDAKDKHDLLEMPPPSGMSSNYLSIVFPHPEWGGTITDYASDYRKAVSKETQGDTWVFEVRTKTEGVKTVISWRNGGINTIDILPRSQLLDNDTLEILVEDTSETSRYTVNNTEKKHAYIWKYLGQLPTKPDTLPWLMLLL